MKVETVFLWHDHNEIGNVNYGIYYGENYWIYYEIELLWCLLWDLLWMAIMNEYYEKKNHNKHFS